MDEAKRQRKRALDRRTQRDHRKRKQAYVLELEETVRALKASSSSDERLTAAMDEQERLRRRNAQLTHRLDRIKSLLSEEEPEATGPCDSIPSDSKAGDHGRRSVTSQSILATPASAEDIRPSIRAPPENSLDMDVTAINDAQPAAIDWHTTVQWDHTDDGSCIDPWIDTAAANFIHNLQVTLDPRELRPAHLESLENVHNWLPTHQDPRGSVDRELFDILEEARRISRPDSWPSGEPSLQQLLSLPSSDLMARRLFCFFSAQGPAPFHVLAALFWIQYLLFRWYVLGTLSSYLRIPDFLRPSLEEASTPHRICIDVIPCRSVRLSLLNSCTTFDAEQVGFDFFQSLPELWTLSNDKMGSMTPIDAIEKEASKPEFWRMGSSFLRKYPCFETLDDV